jgi:hypothetical protein
VHIFEAFAEQEAGDKDDEAIDRELEWVQQLQKEKDRFAN